MVVVYGSGVQIRSAGQAQIYHTEQCQGPPRLDERSIFWVNIWQENAAHF